MRSLVILLSLSAASVVSCTEQWHRFERPIKSVAVIGAGPAGIQAAATLLQHDFDRVRLFERREGPGGVWFYQDEVPLREPYPDVPIEHAAFYPDIRASGTVKLYEEGEEDTTLDERWRDHTRPSPAWESLKTNTPRQLTGLPDVKWPSDSKWVISVHDIQRHVRAYASYHGINTGDGPWDPQSESVTSYNTRVESLEKVGDKWELQLKKLEKLPDSRRLKASWWSEEFDAVVIASGGFDAPHVPDIPGLKDWAQVRDVSGHQPVWHAQAYRRPDDLKGKNVLLIGASVSAMGISNDIGPHVSKLFVSVRPGNRTALFKRRSYRRLYPEAEKVGEIARFDSLVSNDSIMNGRIVLANGTVLTGIDEVILATGYRHANSYLGPLVNGTIRGDDDPEVKVRPVITEGKMSQFRNVDWRGFYIDDPTLAFTTVRPWTVGRYQALAFAKVWEGTARLPTIEQQWKEYPGHGRSFFSRSFGGVQAEAAFRRYVTWLNNESLVHGGKLVDYYPSEWREEFVYYASSAVGYWEPGIFSRQNFTDADLTPEKNWSSEPPLEIFWNAFVDHGDDY
ncbi:hypothetical protein I302_107213 [Kwoniella bestiolae CBS 10118]|uniref:FAD/NAD(P)-binding domain-containing protein n=1 Tax=Kwoniella bestiolae CBS 10118 TaxID=1296100 RepID=A0A1B9FZ77_9TREE|nr:hypothetical protein I302_07051 [Kwoniella bestiolae CBS 10118]OCF24065.1 hypothetical protein I302_07051 [Kwoniella bestiolae CBS 10118]